MWKISSNHHPEVLVALRHLFFWQEKTQKFWPPPGHLPSHKSSHGRSLANFFMALFGKAFPSLSWVGTPCSSQAENSAPAGLRMPRGFQNDRRWMATISRGYLGGSQLKYVKMKFKGISWYIQSVLTKFTMKVLHVYNMSIILEVREWCHSWEFHRMFTRLTAGYQWNFTIHDWNLSTWNPPSHVSWFITPTSSIYLPETSCGLGNRKKTPYS